MDSPPSVIIDTPVLIFHACIYLYINALCFKICVIIMKKLHNFLLFFNQKHPQKGEMWCYFTFSALHPVYPSWAHYCKWLGTFQDEIFMHFTCLCKGKFTQYLAICRQKPIQKMEFWCYFAFSELAPCVSPNGHVTAHDWVHIRERDLYILRTRVSEK